MKPPRQIRIGNDTLTLQARSAGDGSYELRIGMQTVRLEAGPMNNSGFWFIAADGIRHRAWAAMLGSDLQIRVDGHTWVLGSADPEHGDTAAPEDPTEVTAPMTGTVVDVLCTVGDTIAKDQDVIVLNAMKMEHRLTAACDGKISEISVEAGSTVEAGDILARLAR